MMNTLTTQFTRHFIETILSSMWPAASHITLPCDMRTSEHQCNTVDWRLAQRGFTMLCFGKRDRLWLFTCIANSGLRFLYIDNSG